MRLKRKKLTGDENPQRYLITYADLLTLLFGLFVILYAMSSLDTEKYQMMKEALSETFKKSGEKVLIEGGDGVMDGSKNIPDPIFVGMRSGDLNEIEKNLEGSLEQYLENGKLSLVKGNRSLNLELPEELLFNVGKADIQPEGKTILDTVTILLSMVPNRITVDGHADSDPIKTPEFESNWHLSVKRALNVAYQMVESGLPEYNLSVRGYGSQRPLLSNDTEEGKRKNRRVEISIKEMDPETPSTEGYEKTDTITE